MMRSTLLILWWMSFTMPVWAGQACFEKSSGKLLEYQSAARPGTCVANLKSSGVDPSTIEERQISDAEWKMLYEDQIAKPSRLKHQQEQAEKQTNAEAVRQKLGLTVKEFQDLREAMQ